MVVDAFKNGVLNFPTTEYSINPSTNQYYVLKELCTLIH